MVGHPGGTPLLLHSKAARRLAAICKQHFPEAPFLHGGKAPGQSNAPVGSKQQQHRLQAVVLSTPVSSVSAASNFDSQAEVVVTTETLRRLHLVHGSLVQVRGTTARLQTTLAWLKWQKCFFGGQTASLLHAQSCTQFTGQQAGQHAWWAW